MIIYSRCWISMWLCCTVICVIMAVQFIIIIIILITTTILIILIIVIMIIIVITIVVIVMILKLDVKHFVINYWMANKSILFNSVVNIFWIWTVRETGHMLGVYYKHFKSVKLMTLLLREFREKLIKLSKCWNNKNGGLIKMRKNNLLACFRNWSMKHKDQQ